MPQRVANVHLSASWPSRTRIWASPRSVVDVVVIFVAIVVVVAAFGCGVAPVHRGGVPSGPPTWIYAGPHGRPLAYGGDVCEVAGRHAHEYPPSPKDAFIDDGSGAWKDTRKIGRASWR